MSSDKVQAVVARIVNNRQVVLNRGSNDDVFVGMRFAIINPNGPTITDPVDGRELGKLAVPKAIVKVVHVEDSYCIASTFRTYTTQGGALSGALVGLDLFRNPETRIERIKTSDKTIEDEVESEDLYVKVGDPAESFTGDEFSGWGRGE